MSLRWCKLIESRRLLGSRRLAVKGIQKCQLGQIVIETVFSSVKLNSLPIHELGNMCLNVLAE